MKNKSNYKDNLKINLEEHLVTLKLDDKYGRDLITERKARTVKKQYSDLNKLILKSFYHFNPLCII